MYRATAYHLVVAFPEPPHDSLEIDLLAGTINGPVGIDISSQLAGICLFCVLALALTLIAAKVVGLKIRNAEIAAVASHNQVGVSRWFLVFSPIVVVFGTLRLLL